MDFFLEEVVTKRNRTLNSIIYGMNWLFIVIFGIIAMISFSSLSSFDFSEWPTKVITLVIFGGGAVLMFLKKENLQMEYEYTFTNGDLDIARVLGNKKRRNMTNLTLKSVEACGSVAHQSFQRYASMKEVKKHNWFLNREADLIYLYFIKSSLKHLVIIEPSEKMFGYIKQYLPRGVFNG